MTAPLFLVPAGALDEAPDRYRLDGTEGRHAADVLRLAVGEEVLLSDGAGRLARTTVSATARGALELEVLEHRDDPGPELRVVLVQALAKGDRDLQAVESATELDVDEVLPWQADRSIVRWRAERAARAHAKWVSTVLAATKQSRRSRVPVVGDLLTRRALVDRVRSADLALVLHEEAEETLRSAPLPERGEVLLIVGPEGGIAPAELDELLTAGARPVRLGRTVLRTSTAGPAALAVINAARRWS